MYKKIIIYTLPLFIFLNLTPIEDKSVENALVAPLAYLEQERWVDSVFQQLTPRQRIGQLFMIAAYSNKNEAHYAEIERLVQKYQIGGLIFFQGTPYQQALLTNRYQKAAQVPLLIAMDAEWGLGMRLDSTLSYPKQMTLGALQDDSLIFEMGQQVAHQSLRLGVHINFAPVADVNSNPLNPVIGYRSFGENKYKVARKTVMYMKGMQSKGLMANAKHFPGHGDTESDSHYTMPVINHPLARLDTLELYPFKELIREGVGSMMVAHIYMSAFDEKKKKKKRKKRKQEEPAIPATLSENIVQGLLKNKLGFQGLIFTDALNMKGVSAFYEAGEMDVMALQAGNDVLLFPVDVEAGIKAIEAAIKDKTLKKIDIDAKVKKILRAKYQAQLNKYQAIDTKGLTDSLNHTSFQNHIEKLYQRAITLVHTDSSLVPFRHLDLKEFASISVGSNDLARTFQEYLDYYARFEHHKINPDTYGNEANYEELYQKLSKKSVVVVAVGNTNKWENKNYGIDTLLAPFLERLQTQTQVVLCVYGVPYSLKQFSNIRNVVCAYEENDFTQKLVPQQLFGAISFEGKLPVSVGNTWAENTGITTSTLGRLIYTSPEKAQMQKKKLETIDLVVEKAIQKGMMPSAQVLVARKGKVVWNKGYGHFDYSQLQAVNTHSIYDLASITKVAATTQAIMFLYEQNLLDLEQKASFYLPELAKTNKKHITVKQLLLHQAGLEPFIPYWIKTLDKRGNLNAKYYSPVYSETYPIPVANNLYAIENMEEMMWKWTLQSKVLKPNKQGEYPYVYSDLSFYMLKRIAETLLKQPLETFLTQNLYQPLGAYTLGFNPLQTFSYKQIIPTELERNFRERRIQGTVHDPGAAMLGGVGGHAGLFSNANDLAKWAQMQLQKGSYGGLSYFKPATIDLFTNLTSDYSRRALGWDKPPKGETYSYIPTYASPSSYGHSGFTGTVVWIDPTYDLVIVILANRTFPSSSNRDYINQHIRRKIQDIVYLAMEDVSLDELIQNS